MGQVGDTKESLQVFSVDELVILRRVRLEMKVVFYLIQQVEWAARSANLCRILQNVTVRYFKVLRPRLACRRVKGNLVRCRCGAAAHRIWCGVI